MKYRAYGIVFDSDLEFSELVQATDDDYQVSLKLRNLSEDLDLRSENQWFAGDNERFWFRVRGVGEFLICRGQEITVQVYDDADLALVRLFVIGSAFAALMHQRGALVLHGAVLTNGDKAVLFTGESGAGKSTLAAMLWNRGYKLVTEDVAVLYQQDGQWLVYPGYPFMRVCPDMLTALGLDVDRLELVKIFTHTEKYLVNLRDRFVSVPVMLNEIIVLAKADQEKYGSQDFNGNMDKFSVVANNTYRSYFLQPQDLLEQHFHQCASLARQLTVRKIVRPAGETQIYRTCDFVEAAVWNRKNGNKNNCC
ncbi:MAG: hypothetical protein WCV63_03695 [Negativicutes bacterium]|jgi:hypothetical protein